MVPDSRMDGTAPKDYQSLVSILTPMHQLHYSLLNMENDIVEKEMPISSANAHLVASEITTGFLHQFPFLESTRVSDLVRESVENYMKVNENEAHSGKGVANSRDNVTTSWFHQ